MPKIIEKVFSENEMKSYLFVFYAMLVANIIYIIILQILNTSSKDFSGSANSLAQFLFFGFIILAIIDAGIAFRVYIPRGTNSDHPAYAFSNFSISAVLFETSGMFGFVLGLIQIYANHIHINWMQLVGFFLFSIITVFWIIQSHIIPIMSKFVGLKFKYSAN